MGRRHHSSSSQSEGRRRHRKEKDSKKRVSQFGDGKDQSQGQGRERQRSRDQKRSHRTDTKQPSATSGASGGSSLLGKLSGAYRSEEAAVVLNTNNNLPSNPSEIQFQGGDLQSQPTSGGGLLAKLNQPLVEQIGGNQSKGGGLSLMKRLNPANNSNLGGVGLTMVEGSSSFPMGFNTGVFSMMTDASKIKRKIRLPKDSNFNYSGLLIGPKGNSQKQLQQRTGCKILVRGKGSQCQPTEYEDQEDLHVLVLGDNEGQVSKACAEIERIIFADEQTLNKMKQEQMVQYQQGITGGQNSSEGDFNLSLTTPYGPPSENAFILEVPNECVGLVIGKEGQTIKAIAKRSGAQKVQVATASAPGSKSRNIFVEGDPDAVERVRKELNAIVQTQRKMTSGAVTGSHKTQFQVPVRLIGLVIGKGGQTIKGINTKTGAFVSLCKQEQNRKNKKVLTICGTECLCIIAEFQIDKIVQKGLINLQNTTGGLTKEEADMIHPIQPISQKLARLNIPIPENHPTIMEDPTTQYVLSQSLQSQIKPDKLFKEFLGETKGTVEETIIDDPYGMTGQVQPKKKKWMGRQNI